MKIFIKEVVVSSIPKFSLFAEFFTKPALACFVIAPTMVMVPVVNIWSAITLLVFFFFGDLFTGILASYFEWKQSEKKEKWFFGKGEGYSSDKFKKMFVKVMVYAGAPVLVNQFQKTFLLKNLKYEAISDAELEIATFLILIFCLNEGFSIFHENLPKCGFNLWEQIRKLIGFYKKIKTEIKE